MFLFTVQKKEDQRIKWVLAIGKEVNKNKKTNDKTTKVSEPSISPKATDSNSLEKMPDLRQKSLNDIDFNKENDKVDNKFDSVESKVSLDIIKGITAMHSFDSKSCHEESLKCEISIKREVVNVQSVETIVNIQPEKEIVTLQTEKKIVNIRPEEVVDVQLEKEAVIMQLEKKVVHTHPEKEVVDVQLKKEVVDTQLEKELVDVQPETEKVNVQPEEKVVDIQSEKEVVKVQKEKIVNQQTEEDVVNGQLENQVVNIQEEKIVNEQSEEEIVDEQPEVFHTDNNGYDSDNGKLAFKRKNEEPFTGPKRFCNPQLIEDLHRDDFTSDLAFTIAQNYVKETQFKTKMMNQKIRELTSKAENLKQLLSNVREIHSRFLSQRLNQ